MLPIPIGLPVRAKNCDWSCLLFRSLYLRLYVYDEYVRVSFVIPFLCATFGHHFCSRKFHFQRWIRTSLFACYLLWNARSRYTVFIHLMKTWEGNGLSVSVSQNTTICSCNCFTAKYESSYHLTSSFCLSLRRLFESLIVRWCFEWWSKSSSLISAQQHDSNCFSVYIASVAP